MTIEKFENIINNSESDILDFKREQYSFIENSNEINTAKFIKDIISFCNTIRTESAFIVLGVDVYENGEKELIGIDNFVDDAIFQEKIKNKVTPIPSFCYSTIKYQNKFFGIIEIPVRKYIEPIFSTVKMKGIEVGKVYFRRNSSNSEATGREIILINKWLESLPSQIIDNNINDEVSEIIKKTTTKTLPLSEQIASSLKIAKKYGLSNLKSFCEGELSGWYVKTGNMDVEKELSYRLSKVILSPNNIEINPYSFINPTSQQMLETLKKIDKDAFEQKMFFPQPITEIENYLSNFSEKKDNSLIILSSSADRLFDNPKYAGITIRIFTTYNNFTSIYQGIRQKLISYLLEL